MKNFFRIATLCLIVTFSEGIVRSQPMIYGISNIPQFSSLYTIAASTGVANLVGPISGFLNVQLAFAPNGALIGTADSGSFALTLLTINPATGAATTATPITGVNGYIDGTAIRSDGLVFVILNTISGPSRIYTVNMNSGIATLVGTPTIATPASGLAFSNGGALYLADQTNLYTINQTTAAAALVAPLSAGVGAMKFDPATGKLYTLTAGTPFPSEHLATLNVDTGFVTAVDTLATVSQPLFVITSIAIGPTSSPQPTPAPSSLLLAGVGMLMLAGWTLWTRRHGSSIVPR